MDSEMETATKPPVPVSAEAIPPGKPIDLAFDKASLHDVIRFVGQACGLSVVMPTAIKEQITVHLSKVPCDQALEVLLESRGLWYTYRKHGSLLRIAPREDLDDEATARFERSRINVKDDRLPAGPPVDLDFKNAPLRGTLQMLAVGAGVNLVLPDQIDGKVTVMVKAAPWDVAFATILESHGLWYRYRENGKVVRVAPRVELDAEDTAAFERGRHP